jgi:hypothetical protein
MNGRFFSRITIITILNFATFEAQVLDLAVAGLKVWFQPFKALRRFKASRRFHVQGSMV